MCDMTVISKVRKKIDTFDEGQLFTYNDIDLPANDSFAVSKALSKLVKSSSIERFKKGVFFKPKKTKFGRLQPSESQVIELVMSNTTNLNGYLTGLTIYNRLGLTSQISNQISIASSFPRKSKKIGSLKIVFVKGISPKSKADIELLQLLDAIKDFKKIPDRNDDTFIKILSNRIINYPRNRQIRILELSKKYTPRTRALLGAILELNNLDEFSSEIKLTLNSLSKYKLGIEEKVLPNKNNWSII